MDIMLVLWGAVLLVLIEFTSGQSYKYGPPEYVPGLPIGGSEGGDIIKASGFEVYSSPTGGSGSVPPSPKPSYGPPSGFFFRRPPPGPRFNPPPRPTSGDSRFRIIPAEEFQIPQQHKNLIRYVVMKEFHVKPNGSFAPLQMELGRDTGSPELESMKVQIPPSSATASGGAGSGSSAENNAGEVMGAGGTGTGSQGGYASNPSSNNTETEDDYDDDDYAEEEGGYSVGNNTTSQEVVAAKGVSLGTPNNSQLPTKSMDAFMFSDPNSNSIEAENRQSTGQRNRLRIPGLRNRPRNRIRNRFRNPAPATVMIVARPTAAAVSSSSSAQTSSGTASGPQIEELQRAIQTLTQYFNAQSQLTRQQMSGLSSAGLPPSPSTTFTAPGPLVPSIFGTTGTVTGGYPASGVPASGSSSSSASSGSSSSSGSAVGGFGTSGQPMARPQAADAMVIDADTPPGPLKSFAALLTSPTYGPPSSGSGSSTGAGAGTGGAISSIADAITRPIQLAAGFKSSVINTGANAITAGIRGVATATSALQKTVSNVANAATANAGSAAPNPNLNLVYGPPSTGTSSSSSSAGGSGQFSPLRQIIGLKGQAVRTVANTGKAAVGIVGTKGQLAVKQTATVANTLSKGVSQVLMNNNEALQNVIRHIQSIFAANANANMNVGWSR